MTVTRLTADADLGLGESQNAKDARVEHLWTQLAPTRTSELDFKGLRKGFRRIDHPLQNADDMIKQILLEVDANGDGKIQYEEFRNFVERADKQLGILFKAIDRDGNGRIDMRELQSAFRNAGLRVSNRKLEDFFSDMDDNNDGYITFDEWRDFLLFMPAREYDSKLRAILSYYESVVNVTPEGDSLVSGETLHGLGTNDSTKPLLHALFGSLLRVAFYTSYSRGPIDACSSPSTPAAAATSARSVARMLEDQLDEPARRTDRMVASVERSAQAILDAATDERQRAAGKQHVMEREVAARDDTLEEEPVGASREDVGKTKVTRKFRLTELVPDPGYFLAGGVAGGVSRTSTAPLDRLKVYLLVNTQKSSQSALSALRQGQPIEAVKNAAKPFRDAARDLYKAGGLRSFFAGNGLNVVKIMPETAIKFGSYEAAKRALANLEGHGDPRKINSWSKFTAGGLAGMMAQVCVYPLDTLKFRLQCEMVPGGPQGAALLRQTALRMYADGGLRACYRGVTMGLVGMFPYSAIDMGTFEMLKKTYRKYYAAYKGIDEDDASPGNIATGIIGASSGAFGATVVYPLNVVRTRLQAQGTVMHRDTYTGVWDVARKAIEREGYRGLYKGLTPNLLKVAPALSITWVVYENSKRLLGLE